MFVLKEKLKIFLSKQTPPDRFFHCSYKKNLHYCSEGHSFAQNLKKMENLVEKSTLRAMMLDILLKDKELSKDIFDALVKENPEFVEARPHTYVNEPAAVYMAAERESPYLTKPKTEVIDPNFPVLADLTPERKRWLEQQINKDFIKYDDVFRALA